MRVAVDMRVSWVEMAGVYSCYEQVIARRLNAGGRLSTSDNPLINRLESAFGKWKTIADLAVSVPWLLCLLFVMVIFPFFGPSGYISVPCKKFVSLPIGKVGR